MNLKFAFLILLLLPLACAVAAAKPEPALRKVNVCAKSRMVDTGLVLRGGETLKFVADSDARWKDLCFSLKADGTGRWPIYHTYMGLVSSRLTVPGSPAFALHGRVGCGRAFLIGLGAVVTLRDAGPLVLFTNDVPGFYWNNSGAIPVTITKMRAKKK